MIYSFELILISRLIDKSGTVGNVIQFNSHGSPQSADFVAVFVEDGAAADARYLA